MDKAASATKDAVSSTQHSADRVMNKVSDKVDKARSQATPVMDTVC